MFCLSSHDGETNTNGLIKQLITEVVGNRKCARCFFSFSFLQQNVTAETKLVATNGDTLRYFCIAAVRNAIKRQCFFISNAVYFLGKFVNRFEFRNTKKRKFYSSFEKNEPAICVADFMFQKTKLPFFQNETHNFVGLKYANSGAICFRNKNDFWWSKITFTRN